MKKIIIIAAMALVSLAATAQETKIAYVDFNEVIMLMPEMDAARATLEENEMTQNEILQSMYEEYQTKVQQYQQKAETWTAAIRQSKESELMEIQSRLEQTQQSFATEINQLQQELPDQSRSYHNVPRLKIRQYLQKLVSHKEECCA